VNHAGSVAKEGKKVHGNLPMLNKYGKQHSSVVGGLGAMSIFDLGIHGYTIAGVF
jgi:hypothetical protein